MGIFLGDLGRYSDRQRFDYQHYAQRRVGDEASALSARLERAHDGHFRLAFVDGAEFIIDSTASEVHGIAHGALTFDELLMYLQGPVLGFVLRLKGITSLHASAVVLDGKAIAVVGEGGMGKSTSAAAFAQLGLAVSTDDVLALGELDGTFQTQPGLPRVMLWPDSVRALFGSTDALPRVMSGWDKRYLDLTQPGYHFAQEPAPLGAIYVLGDRLDAASAGPEFESLTGTDALMALVANTYANDFLDSRMRAQEFEVLSHIVRQVPMRRVHAPNNDRAVTNVCQAIIEDFRSQSPGVTPRPP